MQIIDALPEPPAPVSVEVMAHVDALPPDFRALVHEYGITIVLGILDEADVALSADEVRAMLEGWRMKRQEQWLRTDYVSRRAAARMFQRAA